MDYLQPIIIIEKMVGDELLPKGYMAEWSGPPESIPEGWKLADLDLSARIIDDK